jgi:NHLM bacteriocin system ABC transporter ATP-binding protein
MAAPLSPQPTSGIAPSVRHRTSAAEPPRTSIRGNTVPVRAAHRETAPVSGEVHIPPEDPLVEACKLVAAELGMNVQSTSRGSVGTGPALHRLDRICDALAVSRRRVLLRRHWWRHDSGPMLGFRRIASEECDGLKGMSDSRPVALLRDGARGYRLVDPRSKDTEIIDAAVAADLARQAFMFYPLLPAGSRRVSDLLVPVLRRNRRDLVMLSILLAGGALLNAALPVATGILLSRVIPDSDRGGIPLLGLALVLAAVGAGTFQLTRSLLSLRLASRLDLYSQAALWSRLLGVSPRFLRRFSTADLAARAQGLGDIRQLLTSDVTTGALAIVVSVSSLALLVDFSPRLAALAAAMLCAFSLVTVLLSRRQLRDRGRFLELQGALSGFTISLIQGIAKLRMAAAEQRAHRVWESRFALQRNHALAAQRWASVQAALTAFYLVLAELTLFAGVGFLFRDSVTPSRFLAFSAAFGQVQAATITFLSLLPDLLSMIPTYQRLQPLLEIQPESEQAGEEAGDLLGKVEVRDACFRYQPTGPPVLAGVSVEALPGELVALVGPTGSGKSTLVRLLLGFECPESGEILYDGRDLRSLDLRSVRRQIGAVLQDSRPLVGDLASNITGGDGADHDTAWNAARAAGLEETIRALPMGMRTLVGEGGGSFSGGERQRLLIARAIAHRPRILILDEATSALDNPGQDHVRRCLEGLDATRFVVAHRLSTVRNADRIYVLEAGRVIEVGTYDELAARGGAFAQLIQRQLA